MRSVLTAGGIPTFISSQEYEFLEAAGDTIYKNKLNEREAEVARVLTTRGILQRFKDDANGIYYMKNTNKGIK